VKREIKYNQEKGLRYFGPGETKGSSNWVRERELDVVSKPSLLEGCLKHSSKHPLRKELIGFPELEYRIRYSGAIIG
jgi:hypothetical protein